MAGSTELDVPTGGGGGGLDELIRVLARYSSALERVALKLNQIEQAPTRIPTENAPQEKQAPIAKPEQAGVFDKLREAFQSNVLPIFSRVVAPIRALTTDIKIPSFAPVFDPIRNFIKARFQQPANEPADSTDKPGVSIVGIFSSLREAIKARFTPTSQPGKQGEKAVGFSALFEGIRSTIQAKLAQAISLFSMFRKQPDSNAPKAVEPTEEKQAPTNTPQAPLTPQSSILENLMAQLVRIAEGIARKMGVETKLQEPESKPESEPVTPSTSNQPKSPKPVAKGSLITSKLGKLMGVAKLAGGLAAKGAGTTLAGAGMVAGAALAAPMLLMNGIKDVAAKISGFVSAINPGLVMSLGLAFKDLEAVVGMALQPVMKAIVPIIKQFTDALLPVAKLISTLLSNLFSELQPAIDALTDVFYIAAQALMPIIEAIGSVLKFLVPIFVFLANAIKAAYLMVGIFVAAIMAVIKSLFANVDSGGLKDVMAKLQDGMKMLVQAFVRGIAYMLKFFGMTSGLEGMQKFLKGMQKPKESAQGIAAAQSAEFTSIEQLGKSAALASVIATAGGPEKQKQTDQDYFEGMVEELEAIAENGPTLIDAVNAVAPAVGEYLLKLPAEIGKVVSDAISSTAESAGQVAYDYNPLKAPGEALGDLAGWLIYGSPK